MENEWSNVTSSAGHLKVSRRAFLATPALARSAPAQPAPRPNILLILADDLGYGDLGCYGQKRIQTPHIDRLAASGIRFTQAYAGSTVCAPSRCCLMTGLHTGHATVRGNKKPEVGLKPSEITVASLLKQAGYRTALFGKWGLGGPGNGSVPTARGFDHFFGFYDQQHAHNSYPGHIWDGTVEKQLPENWFNRKKTFVPDLFAARAIEFLKAPDPRPFFLYFATTIPHANNELGAIQPNGMDSPDDGPYASENWPAVEKSFAATITRLDTQVGQLVDTLKAQGLYENTLILFSSDNGPHREGNHDVNFFSSSGPLRGLKRDLYEGGIRVPMIATWKARIAPQQVIDTPWAFWDFLPTAAALAGVNAPPNLDGVSIAPLLLGQGKPQRSHFYWEFHERGFQQAVRRGDWKLVRQAPKFELELFNLAEDVGETRNLAAQYPKIVAELEKLFRQRTDSPDFPVRPA
ncbi:MAG: arylsulfatase [Bryobacteraceae bacterium]|nr:arylsulfatase [Bryobacteraceae bacterium]MDW8379879.1 arylsulfatase [Bryobacterales bacterium]